MLEMLQGKPAPKPPAAQPIIIAGWNEQGMTKSSAPYLSNGTWVFSQSEVSWLRIPYQGTLDMSVNPPDTEITTEFTAHGFFTGTSDLRLWSRYRQGSGASSYCMNILKDGSINFIRNDARIGTTGKINLGQRHKLVLQRVAGTHRLYLDGVLVMTSAYAGSRNADWDWTIGSLLNSAGAVIESGVSGRWDWELFKFEVKTL